MIGYDAVLKWAVLSTMLAALTVLASCAETGPLALAPGAPERAQPPRPARTGPPPTEASLIGKAGSDVQGVLGAPALLRQEMGAQVWQYASARCVLLIYLYEEADSSYRVTHVEARPKPGGVSGVDSCLADTYATS
jgi:hypothetical protein